MLSQYEHPLLNKPSTPVWGTVDCGNNEWGDNVFSSSPQTVTANPQLTISSYRRPRLVSASGTSAEPQTPEPTISPQLIDHRFVEIEPQETIEALLSRLVRNTHILFRNTIAARLGELHEDCKNDPDEPIVLSVDSVTSFIRMCELAPRIRKPLIGVSPDGNIYAQWMQSKNHQLGIHFLPNGSARLIAFLPNPTHHHKTDQLQLTTTADTLIATLTKYHLSTLVLP